MTNKLLRVELTLSVNDQVAAAIARAELEGVYSSSAAALKLKELEESGITFETLKRYFKECAYLQAAFCQDRRNFSDSELRKLGFRFSELKQLYLPTLTATVLSQLGDVVIGGYRIEVYAAAEAKVDHKWILEMSEALYSKQHILFCEKDQIGVANRQADANMMSAIVVTIDEADKVIKAGVMTGTQPDSRAIALGVMMGLTLRNAAYGILYPFEEYIPYGRPSGIVSISNPVS